MQPNITRTFRATCYALDCGVIRERTVYTLTITGLGLTDSSCVLDGEACPVERALEIRAWAKDGGVWEQIGETLFAPTPTPTSKRDASELHADLGRLGFANRAHYEVASAKVGREISSLTELTAAEVQDVWAHACLIKGFSTPCIRYFGRSVAA